MTLALLAAIGGMLLHAEAPSFIDSPIVLTQVPTGGMLRDTPPLTGILACDNAHIGIINPGSNLRLLTEGFHSACDPEVSFDGQRILFAGKKTATDSWNIYEIGLDGSGLRQITKGLGDCRSPLYLSTLYTLISDKPWHQVAFLSNMAKTAGEYGQWPVASIYSCRIDGTGLMRLTHGPSGDMDPFLMSDGRLLFSSWRPRFADRPARLPLFAVNIDGTDLLLFSDTEGRRHKRMPCVTTERLAIFVESEQLRPDGAGNLACVSLRRNLHSYRQITRPGEGLFRSPSPARDGRVLVSMRPEDRNGTFGIYVLDPDSGTVAPVFDDPKHHEIQVRALEPRPEPDGRSTSVLRRTGEIEDPHALEPQEKKSDTKEMPSGRLYCLNVYNSNFTSPATLPRGTVKRLRVLEGLLPAAALIPSHQVAAARGGGAGSSGATGPPMLKRRFLGEVPVDEDGSFNLHVPANIPIELQILDADGLALASCSWIWVKNNEPRGCIGCHEHPELAPENRLVTAVARPSLELVLPPERRRNIDFLHDIMPIIRSKCVSCHKTGGSQPWLDENQSSARAAGSNNAGGSYENLLSSKQADNPGRLWGGRYVTPGRARTSPLIWHLLGRNASQPWDSPVPSRKFKPMPSAGKGLLSEDELRTFAEWIDTGAHWDNRSAQSATTERLTSRGVSKP